MNLGRFVATSVVIGCFVFVAMLPMWTPHGLRPFIWTLLAN